MSGYSLEVKAFCKKPQNSELSIMKTKLNYVVLTVLPALLLLASTLLFFAGGPLPDASGNSAVPNKTHT